MALTDDQVEQYSRQIILRELGGIGQLRLLAARVLLLGDGPAVASAATYLVGAGIGSLDVGPARDGLAFAPLEDRNHDVRIGNAPASADLPLYDVLIEATPIAVSPRSGRTKRGEIRIYAGDDGVHVEWVSSGAGCLDCRPPLPGACSSPSGIDGVAAGSMGALTALLWVAGVPRTSPAERLTLARGAPTWIETPLGPTPGCSRPCRP